MKKFYVTYARIPTNYNPHSLKLVEADNDQDARNAVWNWLEERLLHKDYYVVACEEKKEPLQTTARIIG